MTFLMTSLRCLQQERVTAHVFFQSPPVSLSVCVCVSVPVSVCVCVCVCVCDQRNDVRTSSLLRSKQDPARWSGHHEGHRPEREGPGGQPEADAPWWCRLTSVRLGRRRSARCSSCSEIHFTVYQTFLEHFFVAFYSSFRVQRNGRNFVQLSPYLLELFFQSELFTIFPQKLGPSPGWKLTT